MSATLTQLLTQATTRVKAAPPARATAEQAITALEPLARAAEHLSSDGVDARLGTARELELAIALGRACRTAAAAWEPRGDAVPTLAGAAADLIARWSPQLSTAQRWAIVVAIAETAVEFATAALRHAPYAKLADLAAVRGTALALEQHAAVHPPVPLAARILDRAVPAAVPAAAVVLLDQAVVETASELVASVRSAVANRTLTVADAIAAVHVVRYAAHHGVVLAASASATLPEAQVRPDASAAAWRSTASAWLAVQMAYAPFDDGTKHAKQHPRNPVRPLALHLYEELRQLATEAEPLVPGSAGAGTWTRRATALREISQQLPVLSEQLHVATERWGQVGLLLAREGRLERFERNHDLPVRPDRVVIATVADLAGVLTALSDARDLSIGLAAELDRFGPPFAEGRTPRLAAAYRQAVSELRPSAPDRRSRRAQHQLDVNPPPQWGYRPEVRPAPPSPSRHRR